MDAIARPEHVLLHAIRVLHERGAHRIQIAPAFYATGHWRCSILIEGEPVEPLKYSNGMGWRLPGRSDDDVVDVEQEADAIWAVLTPEQRDAAVRPDPAYAVWYAALLEACGETVPALWDDYTDYRGGGYVWIGPDRSFPLPPGDSLRGLG